MTTHTVTKSSIELDSKPINANYVRLNYITLYKNMYNMTEPWKSIDPADRSKFVTHPAGYYTYEKLQELIPDFNFDETTLKTETKGAQLGKVIENGYLYLSPLCLYLYLDCIDTSVNFLNGKRSTLLTSIPIGNTDVGEIFTYQPSSDNFKKLYSGDINHIRLIIKDENDKPFSGRFTAELLFK